MTCQDFQDRINRYLDGELTPSERALFEEHLTACPVCQHELNQMQALFAVLDALQAVEVPSSFGREVLVGLPHTATLHRGRWILVAQVAVSLILLALAFPTWQAWYGQVTVRLAPGWLYTTMETLATRGQGIWAEMTSTLRVDLPIAWPKGFGLTWAQAGLMTLTLAGLWWLANRSLLAPESNRTGGTR
jgi:anti-sigma factor RsiW